MKKTEDKIQQLENQILEEHVNQEKELLITEMKKIGIEELPYSYSALKQFIDPETMKFHYTKHYMGYVDKLNDALSKKKYGDLDLERIIKTIGRFDKTIRNNAGGAFNHALFWNMLTPEPKKLDGELYKKITKQWGTFTNFKKEFEKQAKERFGSGWVWLILTSKNTLKIMSTPNQDNPLMNVIEGGGFPLLGLDLWEHAYYLKYRNKRDEYITNFWKVVNWDFVTKMYEMKVETKLTESVEMKKLMTEAKSDKCSQDEVEACKMLFNVNKKIKSTYQHGVDEIVKEVFQEKYVARPNNNELPGIYDLEKEGRSVINKLNTNYNTFCIIMKDLNSVITKETKKAPINYDNKTPAEQVKETERFVNALKHFAYRIFNTQSSTFINVMKVLEEKNKVGDILEGRITFNTNGSSYFTSENISKDIYIHKYKVNKSLHLDTVKIKVIEGRGRDIEGEVIEIIERNKTEFVGTIQLSEKHAFFIPDNKKINVDFFIPLDKLNGALHNQKVLIKLTE
jgi:Fe-Mn family superoxide dismutase